MKKLEELPVCPDTGGLLLLADALQDKPKGHW